MLLYLVRHGQSTNNAGLPRVVDPNLTDVGREQARLTAVHFETSALAPRHLYSSPMRRALQTSLPMKERLGLPPFVHPDVCETGGLSEGAGMTRAAMEAEFPEYILNSAITDSGWADPALRVETETGSTLRAMRLWDMLIQRHAGKNDTVVMVSHGDFGGFLLAYLFDGSSQKEEFFNLCNCSISLIETDSQATKRALRYLNRTEHLPAELLTK